MFICFINWLTILCPKFYWWNEALRILELGGRFNILNASYMVDPKLGILHIWFYLSLYIWYCNFHLTDFLKGPEKLRNLLVPHYSIAAKLQLKSGPIWLQSPYHTALRVIMSIPLHLWEKAPKQNSRGWVLYAHLTQKVITNVHLVIHSRFC